MNKCEYYKKINFIKNAQNIIVLQSVVEATDGFGDYSYVWTNIATVNSIVRPFKQFEKMQYAKMDSEVMHEIIVRYQSVFNNPLTSVKYRIMFNNRQLEIKECINLFEDNKYVRIIANEVQS